MNKLRDFFEVDKHNNVQSGALLALLQLAGVEDHNGSLEDIVSKTQESWRKTGIVSAMVDGDEHEEKRAAILKMVKQLGFVDAINPDPCECSVALFLGATTKGMMRRIGEMIRQKNRSVVVREAALLASLRKTSEQERMGPNGLQGLARGLGLPGWPESYRVNACYTEAGLQRVLWQVYGGYCAKTASCSSVTMPAGTNTLGTIKAWVEDCEGVWPEGTKVLLPVGMPYLPRVYAEALAVMPSNIELVPCGYACPDTLSIAQILDEIAKALWSCDQLIRNDLFV